MTFTATSGACWLGAQDSPTSSSYLQEWTLAPGQTVTYQATGPLAVKIGAPKYVTIKVDGRVVALPAGNIDAYDISFVSSTGTSV